MWFTDASEYLIGYANEVCFSLAIIVSLLFFRQYKKYEAEEEQLEMIDKFLSGNDRSYA